jgi:DNA invertase Pin-like site-specific DNA recombinase
MIDWEKIVRVAFYIRVSTDEQKNSWFWVEMQINALKDLLNFKANSANWISKDEWFFVDKWLSWKDLNRPEYNKMMSLVKKKEFDIIAVWKIDRISRNLSHLLFVFEELQKYWVSFYSLKESIDFSGSIWKLTFQIFGALAEFERETIKIRTTEWKMASARMGNYIRNRVPFWYKKIPNLNTKKWSTLIINEEEAEIVRKIFDWFIYERKNYASIASELNKIYPKKFKKSAKWFDKDIWDLIRDNLYLWFDYSKFHTESWEEKIIPVKIPQLLSDTVFRQAQFIAEKVSETKGKKWGGEHIYLLSRKITYIESGRTFVWYQRIKWGHSYRHKKFIDKITWKSYENIEIPGEVIDGFVWDKINDLIRNPKEFFKIFLQQNNLTKEIQNMLNEQEKIIKKEEQNNVWIINLDDDFYKWKISEERRTNLVQRYEKEIEEWQAKLTKLQKEIDKYIEMEASKDALEYFSKNFNQQIDNLSIEQKQVIIDILVEKIEVSRIGEDIHFTPYFRFAKKTEMNFEQETNLKTPSVCQNNGIERGCPSSLEVPPGVEPGYKALQASA